MNSLVVIRVGEPNNFFYEQMERGVWSTTDSQHVRDAFVQERSVFVLFVESNDTPLYIGRVSNVRPRNVISDAAFPNTHTTFFVFQPIIISYPPLDVFSNLLATIRFVTGVQVVITDLQIVSTVIAFYHGLYQGRNTIPLNHYTNRVNVNYIPQ
jgi:hypothetical protein